MTDGLDRPATPDYEPTGRRRRALSAVWLVPIVAIMIAGAIAWQSLRDRGSLISITFPDASGVTIGETTLRFREVIVGVVEDVGFTSDLDSVNVYVRVNNEIAPYLDEDAAFWIVQPTVTTRGVEGLGTILSGTYIEGTWDSETGEAQQAFVGDERAPIVPPGVEGTAVVLRASDSARLGAGAPILYKGIQVGEVAAPRLSPDGSEVRLDAFILAPYDRQLTTATRFWDASGVSVSLGGSGVELNVGSLAAIVEGGIVFDTLISGGEPVASGYVFDIFEDRGDALASAFEAPAARAIRFGALFPSAAAGLTEGAPVRFQGVRVGVVSTITGFIRPDDPTNEIQLLAVMAIEPSRMGLEDIQSDLDGIDFVGDLVRDGLRAQLVSTSLLGGELAVDLVQTEAGAATGLDIGIADNPLIPTIPGDTPSITATAEGVLTRINDLPIEELLAAATDLLNNVNRIAADADTRAIPAAALAAIEGGGGLIRDARAIVASPQTAGVLADVQAITADLRAVSSRIAERDLVDEVAATLAAARGALANVEAGTENLAEIGDRVLVLVDEAGRFVSSDALQAVPGLARDTLAEGRAILASPAIAALLDDAAAATADVRRLAAAVGDDAALARIEATLAAVERTALNVAEGTQDVAALRASLDAAVGGAEALLASEDVAAIPALAREAVAGARDVLAAPALETVLADVAATTGRLRALAEGIGPAETAARITTILRNVDATARGVAAGTADLAALRASIDAAAAGAEALLTSEGVQAIPGDVGGVLAEADGLLGDARAVIRSPEIQALLADLPAITQDIRTLTARLAQDQAAEALTAALRAAERAAASVAEGAERLPELSTSTEAVLAEAEILGRNLNALTEKANALELDALVDATTDLMRTADRFLSSDEAGDVPVVLAETLEEVRRTVETIRVGGTLDNVNATLSSAAGAADSIARSATDLPALVARLQGLTGAATEVLAAYDSDSRIAQELFATLRAATRAAEDVSSLSRTIERNPNSLLLGR